MIFNDQQRATVLAALRFWQQEVDDMHDAGEDDWTKDSLHFTEHRPLTTDEIDALCEEINADPAIKIGVYVEGGLVQGMRSNYDGGVVDVIMYDHDNVEQEDEDEQAESAKLLEQYEALPFGIY